MRLRCLQCGKSVSTEVPDGTIVRAFLQCPECIETSELEKYKRAVVLAKGSLKKISINGINLGAKVHSTELGVWSIPAGYAADKEARNALTEIDKILGEEK